MHIVSLNESFETMNGGQPVDVRSTVSWGYKNPLAHESTLLGEIKALAHLCARSSEDRARLSP